MQLKLKDLAGHLAEGSGLAYKDARGLFPSTAGNSDITEEVIMLIQAVAKDCAELADHLDTTPSHKIGNAIRERFGI